MACQGSSRNSCPYNAWAAHRLRTSISPSGHRPIVKFRLPVLRHRLLARRAWRETAVALSIFALDARRWHRAARPNHSLKWSANGLPPGPASECTALFHWPGLAASRRRPLSSNVRPHRKPVLYLQWPRLPPRLSKGSPRGPEKSKRNIASTRRHLNIDERLVTNADLSKNRESKSRQVRFIF